MPAFDPMRCTGAQIIENVGQADIGGGTLYLLGEEASVIFRADRITVVLGRAAAAGGILPCSYDVVFEGARPVVPEGIDPTGTTYNYFLGDDPSLWTTGVRGFAGARYAGLWDGIDLVYRLAGGELKYDALVAPGACPDQIRMRYSGVDAVRLEGATGALSVETAAGTCTDGMPASFQQGPSGPVPVESGFELLDPWTVGFAVGRYDRSSPLVIDPQLVFSTYLGTGAIDYGESCALGPGGDLWIQGATNGDGFPLQDPLYDKLSGGTDVFVSRLSSDGEDLLYSTYIGGSENDNGQTGFSLPNSMLGAICVDDSGAVYVTGHTMSADFPITPGAMDSTFTSSYDGFVLKLSPEGDALEFSTFIGSNDVYPTDICLDSAGNPVICGFTSDAFPTTAGAYDTTYDAALDVFVAKLDASGDTLLCSSYLGDYYNEYACALALGPEDAIYVAGYANDWFPTTAGAYDRTYGGAVDMFVAKFDSNLSSLAYSTYIGTSSLDKTTDLAVDGRGRAYVLGFTKGHDFPVVAGCYDTSYHGMEDVVVLRLSANGSRLERSTFYGAANNDEAFGLGFAPDGDVYVGGHGYEHDVPTTPDAYDQSHNGGWDLFLARFDAELTALEFGSMYGSTDSERAWDLAIDQGEGTIFLVGDTDDASLPTTTWAYDRSYNGVTDTFAMKFGVLLPPRWGALDPLAAEEDVPLVHDFSSSVVDPDTRREHLSIASTSSFFLEADGLNVTFLFPEGVTEAIVPLTVYDGFSSADALVNFTVLAVNDPPVCIIPTRLTAMEDVPHIIEFGPYVTDPDNTTDELSLIVSSPCATIEGLNLTVTYPEGILSDVLWVNVTDGLLATEVRLEISVTPVDDPPTVLPLPEFVAVEDADSVFNVTPFLRDVDTPTEHLSITVRDANCTVVGADLHFLFHRPATGLVVPLEVADRHATVTATLHVTVTPVNDPPVVRGLPPQPLNEDEPATVDLSECIEDEDTPRGELVLECTDPHLVHLIEGLNLTLLFTEWVPEQTITFSVFDGSARTNGSLDVQVQAVNDPPVILTVGGLPPPVTISIDAGTELYLQVLVSDEDSTAFRYTVSSKWSGIMALPNGTIRLVAASGAVGDHTATLSVDDMSGGNTSVPLTIHVLDVNDPPTMPILVLPQNHTIVEEGTNVTFSVDVTDPDVALGQVLTVSWVSNVSGLIGTLTSEGALRFATDRLPVGTHRITVTVTDGEYTSEAWLELTVTPKHVQPPQGPGGPSSLAGTTGIAAAAIIAVLAVVGVVLLAVTRRRRGADAGEERASALMATAPAPPPTLEPVTAPIKMEGDLAAEGRRPTDVVSQLEAVRAAEARAAAAMPAPALEAAPLPVTKEDEADRERTREIREMMRSLTQLPQGLPTTLWGWDMAELARATVDGPKRTASDGTGLVGIKGRWYNADRTNVGVFMREWKEPEETPQRPGPMTVDERQGKLERLEAGLLEGKISEQTYRELKRKYEGGG
jgi:hypothetical protein